MMSQGTVTYSIKCDCLELKSLEIPLKFSSVQSVTLETKDDSLLETTFKTIKIYEEDKARNIVDPIVKKLIDRLSFFLKINVKEPQYKGSKLPADPNRGDVENDSTHTHDTFSLNAIFDAILVPGPERRKAIIDFLKEPDNKNDLLISE